MVTKEKININIIDKGVIEKNTRFGFTPCTKVALIPDIIPILTGKEIKYAITATKRICNPKRSMILKLLAPMLFNTPTLYLLRLICNTA